MKYTFLLLAVLLLAVGSCASKKGLSGPEQRKRVNSFRHKRVEQRSIAGFWQEYKRTVSKKHMAERTLEFTDTLKVVFRDDSTTRFYDMHSRISAGKFIHKEGLYHLGNGQTFATIEHLGDTLKLGKHGKLSYLRKVPGFYTTPFGPERTDKEEDEENDVLDALFLQGKWKVYKKEDENFSRQKTYLKSFDIKESHADGTYELIARYHNAESVFNDGGSIEIEEAKITMNLKKQLKQEYIIIRAKDQEMILKQGEVTYYFKNLSK